MHQQLNVPANGSNRPVLARTLSIVVAIVGLMGGLSYAAYIAVSDAASRQTDLVALLGAVTLGLMGMLFPRIRPTEDSKGDSERLPVPLFMLAAFCSLFVPYGVILSVTFLIAALLRHFARALEKR